MVKSGLQHTRFWPYLLATFIVFIARLPTLNNNIIWIDEPEYLNEARRLDSFEAFVYSFHYITETKFPLSLIPYLIAQLIDQPNAILLVHLFGLIALLFSACLLIYIARILFNDTLPAIFTLLLFCLYLNRNASVAAPLLEYFQLPFILLSFSLFIKGVQNDETPQSSSKSNIYLFATGFNLGLAALVKPPSILVAPALVVVFLFYQYELEIADWVSRFKRSAFLLLGLVIPPVIFILPYFLRPSRLADLKFNLIDVTTTYVDYFGENKGIVSRVLGLLSIFNRFNFLLIVLASGLYIYSLSKRRREKWRRIDLYQLFLLVTGWSLFSGYTTGQIGYHYLVPVYPFIMLFVGYQLKLFYNYLTRYKFLSGLFLATICLGALLFELPSFAFYTTLLTSGEGFFQRTQSDIADKELVNYIQTNTGPEDSIWVYYGAPQIYWEANRPPATTDPSGYFLISTYSPSSFWLKRTTDELDLADPRLIIGIDYEDCAAQGHPPCLLALPVVKEWLQQNYSCDSTLINHTTICRRHSPI